MLKISDSLDTIIKSNQFLQAGLSHRLFNLTQLARLLHPLVEARLQKQVQVSAIVMNLSRLQKTFERPLPFKSAFSIAKLTLQAHLFSVTFSNTPEVRRAIQRFQKHVYQEHGFISITQSGREIAMIVEQSFLEEMPGLIKAKPVYINTNITGIGVQFSADYSEQPGFLYQILQRIALQNINVVEVSSTHTEFTIFFDHEDAKLALDTLYSCFKVEGEF